MFVVCTPVRLSGECKTHGCAHTYKRQVRSGVSAYASMLARMRSSALPAAGCACFAGQQHRIDHHPLAQVGVLLLHCACSAGH